MATAGVGPVGGGDAALSIQQGAAGRKPAWKPPWAAPGLLLWAGTALLLWAGTALLLWAGTALLLWVETALLPSAEL